MVLQRPERGTNLRVSPSTLKKTFGKSLLRQCEKLKIGENGRNINQGWMLLSSWILVLLGMEARQGSETGVCHIN